MTAATTATAEHLRFALALHRILLPDADRPGCWSPYSVAAALGMTATAARGDTRTELLTALAGGGPAPADPAAIAALLTVGATLDDPPTGARRPVLRIADALWVSDELTATEPVRAELPRWPGAQIRPLTARTDPVGATREVNAWVAELTERLIPALLGPGVVRTDTLAILVSALYLRVAWRTRFPAAATAREPFHAPAGTRDVPMMRLLTHLPLVRAAGWTAVTVPALGGCAAVALLPDAGLPAAEAALTAPVLDGLLARLDEPAARTRVELRMPRFAVRAAAGLVEPLRTLGVHRAFSADADLSGLVGGLRARISEVRHEAVLRVDESGLEGAAATAVMIARAAFAREDPPVPVRLDRPFLLLVRHQRSGVIYFLARVTEP